ncbi:probable periplasmic serine endoprotease DegP-like [Ylistrum balloti]|uniref:probable periplasmic serine endoprotease DegP-like n=1 Tax=Ylistrum balloti TaxID=509963 RepID=UPI002905CB83|nr:probable periplasmic serine endoprotease DegP-like [Ylistrum balloti]
MNAIRVTLHDGTMYNAHYHNSDKNLGIAILFFESEEELNIAPLPIAVPKVAEKIYAIGVAYGNQFSITKGVVSAIHRTREDSKALYFQTDAAINKGGGGGLIINAKGESIGLSVEGNSILELEHDTGLNYAITLQAITKHIERLIGMEKKKEKWLGVTVYASYVHNYYDLGIRNYHSVLLNNIYSSEYKTVSTLRLGDIITAVNGEPLRTSHLRVFSNSLIPSVIYQEGELVLSIVRRGNTYHIPYTPSARPDNIVLQSMNKTVWPGYVASPLLEHQKEAYGLSKEILILHIESILPQSPADDAGLEEGDMIIALNQKEALNYHDHFTILHDALAQRRAVEIATVKHGTLVEYTVLVPPKIGREHTSLF